MVEVAGSPGSNALCRVSLVQFAGMKVCVDTWVEVEGKVTNFRTAITGVDANAYAQKRKVPFSEARAMVQAAIKNKIVVGHALWNDFAALQITHPVERVRDTALNKSLRPPWRSNPLPSLRLLANFWLNKEVHGQAQEHDSVEDASTALLLYKFHRATWEPTLGNQVAEGDWTQSYRVGPPTLPFPVANPYWWPGGF
jgi:RNA exonuclease 4